MHVDRSLLDYGGIMWYLYVFDAADFLSYREWEKRYASRYPPAELWHHLMAVVFR